MKNIRSRTILTTLLILAALIFSTTGSSCRKKREDAEKDAKAAASTVYQLSGLIDDLVSAADKAYDEGLLDASTRPQAVGFLRKLNAGAKTAQDIVGKFEVNNETPPPSALDEFGKILSNEVVQPLFAFLALIGAIPETRIPALQSVISAIRLAVLSLAGTLGEYGVDILDSGVTDARA